METSTCWSSFSIRLKTADRGFKTLEVTCSGFLGALSSTSSCFPYRHFECFA